MRDTSEAPPLTVEVEGSACVNARLWPLWEVSAREVIAAHVERIEALDGAINAVVTRSFDMAAGKAALADAALARGEEPGPLHGLPVAHKDLADTAGVRTTYGSVLFAGHVPDRDSLVVQRMAEAGAISLGKTNTPHLGLERRLPVLLWPRPDHRLHRHLDQLRRRIQGHPASPAVSCATRRPLW